MFLRGWYLSCQIYSNINVNRKSRDSRVQNLYRPTTLATGLADAEV